jgi:type I restriction enzyme M protein
MNHEVRRKLDLITNALFGGGADPLTNIEQVSYLIYLKLLDEEEASRLLRMRIGDSTSNGNSNLLFPNQASRYRWSEWRFKSGPELRDFVRDEVFPYLSSLVKDAPFVAEYFSDATLRIDDAHILKQVVDEIDTINFRQLGPDVKGDIYEYLLSYLGGIDPALLGQYRTPRQVRKFMVEMVAPDFAEAVFDPACGTGGFLVDYVEYMLAYYSESPREVPIYGDEWLEKRGLTIEQAKQEIPNLQTYQKGAGERIPDWKVLEHSVYGVDVSRQLMRIAMMNLVLHGIEHANLKRANSLSEIGGLTEDDLTRRYKIILSNPPFAGQLPKDSIRKDLPTTSKKSELLFLGMMMKHLAPGGRCAVVVPEGLLFGSTGSHVELRRKLTEDFDLLAVVSLPAGVFKPYAGVKTSVLVFRRPAEERRRSVEKVWFFEVKNDGYDPDKIQGGGRPETPEKNDIPRLLDDWRTYKSSGFKSVPGVEASSMLNPGSEIPASWWAGLETIAATDYNLASGRYKPRIGEAASNEDPAQLIREVIGIEQKIQSGLEKLLTNVEASA